MITVNHLSKKYINPDGSVLTVLKDINCTIEKGEVISIIGPSGTGKSTLLRALNLLDPPTGGEILFQGENILAKGYPVHKLRQKMGMVFQSFNLFDHMTVLENVMFSPVKILGKSKEEAREAAMTLLRKVGVADKADVYPSSLSGGQKQRVAIARCLAMNPEVILCDAAVGEGGDDDAHRDARDEIRPRRKHPGFLHVRRLYPRGWYAGADFLPSEAQRYQSVLTTDPDGSV